MKKPVIVVVDDEQDARATVRHFLEGRYEGDFYEAEDGEEALAFVRSHPCDVMLLDIKMPKKGGMAVIKEAKTLRPDIDILIISGWVSEEVAEEALAEGATDYAIKPVDLKVVSLKFADILQKRGQLLSKLHQH